MNNAWERAVEAGARAASPHAFNDEFWLSRKAPDHHQRHAQKNARQHAEASIRAAFPILAEELVAWHVDRAVELRAAGRTGPAVEHMSYASALRARIEQMKEPQT